MNPNKRKIDHYILFLLMLVVAFSGISCESPAQFEKETTEIKSTKPTGSAFFNPQPEPPARIFSFETTGDPDGDWRGRFDDTNLNGQISVETLSSMRRGKTLHLEQAWTLHPPEPVEPVQITLKGILNLAKGSIVMNGDTETDGMEISKGTKVHIRGQFTDTGGGAISVGGELMFNPQPEPPALNR